MKRTDTKVYENLVKDYKRVRYSLEHSKEDLRIWEEKLKRYNTAIKICKAYKVDSDTIEDLNKMYNDISGTVSMFLKQTHSEIEENESLVEMYGRELLKDYGISDLDGLYQSDKRWW